MVFYVEAEEYLMKLVLKKGDGGPGKAPMRHCTKVKKEDLNNEIEKEKHRTGNDADGSSVDTSAS